MGANKIQKLTAPELVLFSNSLVAALGPAATPPYGITTAQKTALTTGSTDLSTANAAVETTKAAYRAAVQDRETKTRTCANAAASIARTVYISTATPAQIAALGLSPRAIERTKVIPLTPATITATILPTCGVTLKWSRSGNANGVVFRVETRIGSGNWTFVEETTACKSVIDGYVPGVERMFRVVASKNGQLSAPSPVATIYPAESSSPNFLRLAA